MPGRHRGTVARRKTEGSEYAAMLERMIWAYGKRIAEDPAELVHLRRLEAAMRDAPNLGIATANRVASQPYSMADRKSVV